MILCYLFIACFNWKIGVFQQTVVRVYYILKVNLLYLLYLMVLSSFPISDKVNSRSEVTIMNCFIERLTRVCETLSPHWTIAGSHGPDWRLGLKSFGQPVYKTIHNLKLIASFSHAASRIWACAEPEFRYYRQSCAVVMPMKS